MAVTIGDYINDELSGAKITLKESQLFALYTKNGVKADDELTEENLRAMDIAVIGIIPKLLIGADKATGDTSLKWDRNAILAYYRLKCAEYGLPDDQDQEASEINDVSNMW